MTAKITVTVKWFNIKKGFGFFTDERGDIFVHRSLFERYAVTSERMRDAGNHSQAAVITVVDRADGRRQATAIHSLAGQAVVDTAVSTTAVLPPVSKITSLKVHDHAIGRMKWFNYGKGYGFLEVVGVPNHTDMFLHISAVPHHLRDRLVEGQAFDFVVGENRQGLLAIIQQPHEEMLAAE